MGWIENVKEWFKERGDDITGLDKSFEELINNNLLPMKYYEIYEKLSEKDEDASQIQEESYENFQIAEENRKRYKNELEQKESMFKSKYGGLINIIRYNVLRFSANGKDYHRLKREIKIATRNHEFWSRMSDEKYNIFTASEENRKNRRRELAEYKRIIVSKSKNYKDEFKFIKEYQSLVAARNNKNILKETFGEEVGQKIIDYKDDIRDHWLDPDFEKQPFNLKEVKDVITKLRKLQPITEEDKKVMNSIIDKRKSKMTIKPPVNYGKNGLIRDAFTPITNLLNSHLNLNIEAEDFLVMVNMAYHQTVNDNSEGQGKLSQYMDEAYKKLKAMKQQNPDDERIGKLAEKGAEIFGAMVREGKSGGIPAGDFKAFVNLYKDKEQNIRDTKVRNMNYHAQNPNSRV